jgi:2'-5' RNA ligase
MNGRRLESMARRVFTLAYPLLSATDAAMIAAFRARHDQRYRHMIEPHFTLVFGLVGINERDYIDHVGKIAARATPVPFHCRYAMLGADDSDDTAYVFLVPDEGNSAIARLHDRLYTGMLSEHLRLDLEYMPHMTIGISSGRKPKRFATP